MICRISRNTRAGMGKNISISGPRLDGEWPSPSTTYPRGSPRVPGRRSCAVGRGKAGSLNPTKDMRRCVATMFRNAKGRATLRGIPFGLTSEWLEKRMERCAARCEVSGIALIYPRRAKPIVALGHPA